VEAQAKADGMMTTRGLGLPELLTIFVSVLVIARLFRRPQS